MLRPMACVLSLKTSPCVGPISVKYSIGFTRTRAPVGQFSSHEYVWRREPGGLSDVPWQRLHLIATMSSPGSGVTGGAILKLKTLRSFETKPPFVDGDSRGTIEMASYGHCVAQS